MGTGKLLLQAFLQYPNLLKAVGVELAQTRFAIAELALNRLIDVGDFELDEHKEGRLMRVRTRDRRRRVLEIRCENMWNAVDVGLADVLIMHTELPAASLTHLRKTIGRLKVGCRFVTYQDLNPYWRSTKTAAPFDQLDVNIDDADTFLTSWSSLRGYHLFCWEKTAATPAGFRLADEELAESKDAV